METFHLMFCANLKQFIELADDMQVSKKTRGTVNNTGQAL